MFLIEDTEGDILATAPTLEEAIEIAKVRLDDDPELRELDVFYSEHVRTIAFGPDENWNTQVVVLKPGEKIEAPTNAGADRFAFMCSPDESAGLSDDPYDWNNPKSTAFHAVHADHYDQRKGK